MQRLTAHSNLSKWTWPKNKFLHYSKLSYSKTLAIKPSHVMLLGVFFKASMPFVIIWKRMKSPSFKIPPFVFYIKSHAGLKIKVSKGKILIFRRTIHLTGINWTDMNYFNANQSQPLKSHFKLGENTHYVTNFITECTKIVKD